jgi:hypothetical protein
MNAKKAMRATTAQCGSGPRGIAMLGSSRISDRAIYRLNQTPDSPLSGDWVQLGSAVDAALIAMMAKMAKAGRREK